MVTEANHTVTAISKTYVKLWTLRIQDFIAHIDYRNFTAFGSLLFANVPDSVISLLESIAAGAMLTVISETMLPEAYAKGGSIVGLSTLLGFLAIIVIKSFG